MSVEGNMKRLLDAYLVELDVTHVHSMEDVVAFNKAYGVFELPPGKVACPPNPSNMVLSHPPSQQRLTTLQASIKSSSKAPSQTS